MLLLLTGKVFFTETILVRRWLSYIYYKLSQNILVMLFLRMFVKMVYFICKPQSFTFFGNEGIRYTNRALKYIPKTDPVKNLVK